MNANELERIQTEMIKRARQKKRLAPSIVLKYFELLQPEVEIEEDLVSRELFILFSLYAKCLSWNHLEAAGFGFEEIFHGEVYSMERWLDKIFSDIIAKRVQIDDRTSFITYVANDLVHYIRPLTLRLSYYKVCISVGYIASTVGIINTEDKVNIKGSSYKTYKEYLFRTVRQIWRRPEDYSY
ncbi:MAG: hypothetical protein JST83_18440 [Bacteroidetes bacterium]|nr:hypothetical protein [Bacteroidota bacterium]